MNDVKEKWEKFLDPDVMKDKLVSASLYIATFEMLKDAICDRIRDFYSVGIDASGPIVNKKYLLEVTSRKKSLVYASLDWLLEHEVIDSSDLESFEQIKSTRNQLAHNLQSLVLGNASFRHVEMFQELAALLRKIETWWVVNVEIPTNPDFDGEDIDEEGVVPGPIVILQLILEVAFGNNDLLKSYKEKNEKN